MQETPEVRLRRLRMRSGRRGMKEMDLILGGYAEAELPGLAQEDLDRYEALLSENDQDLYQWVSVPGKAPARHAEVVDRIRGYLARRGATRADP